MPVAMLTLMFIFMYLVSTTNTHIVVDSVSGSTESKLCAPIFHQSVKCTDQDVLLSFGYCATETNGDVYVARCHYIELKGHNVTEPGYIRLPDNISELNDYMCGPMNRKDFLCKDCIDEFGPSVTSLRYKCSNCTEVWYGIPLYLAVELVPITLFYLIILIFKVHLTSAPIVLYILWSQWLMYEIVFEQTSYRFTVSGNGGPLLKILLFFYGIWNLDLIHYIVPPFCINSKLQLTHIRFFGYISVVYLLSLIFLTWICIELHGRNFRLFVVLWRPFHRCFVKLQRGWDKTSDIVDAFASFFLLSHGTLMYHVLIFLRCQTLWYTKDGIPSSKHVSMFVPYIDCSDRSVPLMISFVIILLAFNIIPVLLLIFYPFKPFRVCLSKCKLERLFISIFVEKFHVCYRDGLDGGRDMRSLSGMYYVMLSLMSLYSKLHITLLNISKWLYFAFIFLCFALLVIIVRPYKRKYVNILESVFLAYSAVTCALLSRDSFAGEETQILIVFIFPPVVFGLIVFFKAGIKLKAYLIKECKCLCKQYSISNKVDSEENSNEIQKLIIPTRNNITYGK